MRTGVLSKLIFAKAARDTSIARTSIVMYDVGMIDVVSLLMEDTCPA